jgi:hypothetical protein
MEKKQIVKIVVAQVDEFLTAHHHIIVFAELDASGRFAECVTVVALA